jgi:SAM-dependent methyltransferase
MADTFSGKLQIWDGWRSAEAASATGANGPARREASTDPERINSLFLQETFLKKSRRKETVEPLSLGWFLEIEGIRHGRYGRWLPRQLEFGKHRGEKLLGMGPGLGTDWVQYALQGAEVVACSSSAEQLALVQRNFDLRGLPARFIHADPTVLPLETASIDVACVTSFLEGQPSPAAVVQEMYRVLKPGGKVLVLAPAAYNVAFWCRNWLPWRRKKRLPPQSAGFTAGFHRQSWNGSWGDFSSCGPSSPCTRRWQFLWRRNKHALHSRRG